MKHRDRISKRNLLLAGLLVAIAATAAVSAYRSVMKASGTDFSRWPVDTSRYEIQTLPFQFAASYVRGNDLYFATNDGRLLYSRGDESVAPFVELTSPIPGSGWAPHLIFVSSSGALFLSTKTGPIYRSGDSGRNWTQVLVFPGWRMDEVKPGVLALGNYPQFPYPTPEILTRNPLGATIFLSRDDGRTWTPREVNARAQHVHSVRWDERSQRLYLAYGDGEFRGEGYIDLEADRLTVTGTGPRDGHTDVAFTRDYVFWGSDDGSGRVLREDRKTGQVKTVLSSPGHYIWWIITDGEQLFLGTAASVSEKRSVVLASQDQGESWQKLIESEPSRRPYDRGFQSESRNASVNGWVYCSNGENAYRFRRASSGSRAIGK